MGLVQLAGLVAGVGAAVTVLGQARLPWHVRLPGSIAQPYLPPSKRICADVNVYLLVETDMC